MTFSDDDEKYIECQFKAMVEALVKFISKYANESCMLEPEQRSDKADEMFRIVLTSARTIVSRRLKGQMVEQEGSFDPYSVLSEAMSADSTKQITVLLEALHTTVMAAKDAHSNNDHQLRKLREYLDQSAISIAKSLATKLRSLFDANHSKATKRIRTDSTLFSEISSSQKHDLGTIFENACDFFTKAVSLYQGLEDCCEQTVEWCDILIETIQLARLNKAPQKGDPAEGRYQKLVAGTMAIKAYAESTLGSYGSALKTARGAYEKDGSNLGSLITLFYCLMRHESYSNNDIINTEARALTMSFSNTFLELDHAVDVYLSLSKLETSNCIQSLENLLSSFPVMCKMAIDHEVIINGLLKRMITLTIDMISKIILLGNFEKNICLKRGLSLFDLISSYLASFEDLLPQYMKGDNDQLSEELNCLQHITEKTLSLLVKVRDRSKQDQNRKDNDISYDDIPSFSDSAMTDKPESSADFRSFYDSDFMARYIGGQNQCLWIGKFSKTIPPCIEVRLS